jgi:hypothetical protein
MIIKQEEDYVEKVGLSQPSDEARNLLIFSGKLFCGLQNSRQETRDQ